MPHAIAANLGLYDLHPAFLTHDPAVLHPLVLAAVAFVIFGRSKNLGAEKPVTLRLEGPVVNGLRF